MSTKSRHIPSIAGRNTNASLWTEFIALANQHKAVNLGQGFPDTPMPKQLADHLKDISLHPERTDWHQYTRGFGHLRFVNILSKFYSRLLKNEINPQNNVVITVGAYLALYYSFMGWLNPGDEAIVIEPAYDSYVEQIRLAGGVPIPVVLQLNQTEGVLTSSAFTLDFDELRRKITPKTKILVINNPNNPTGKLYNRSELEELARIAEEFDLIVISDEVYEYHVYPGNEMIRFASLPGMFNRTITIGSAGKCFSATGWKTGWAIAPEWLLGPLKKIHEQCVFTVPTPTQEALARQFEIEEALFARGDEASLEKSYLANGLWRELLPKRDALANSLRAAGFNPIVPDAGYFIMADFGHLEGSFKDDDSTTDSLDYKFVRWLCKEKKLAAIPPSAFYSKENRRGNDHYIRLCFFKKDETLNAGIKILQEFSKK